MLPATAAETRTVQVGDGTELSEVHPIINWWMDTYQGNEVIYYAEELGLNPGDQIVALSYHCVENYGYGGNFNVRIIHTDATRFEDEGNDGKSEDTSFLLVDYDAPVYGNVELAPYSAGDWITFPLSTPFVYEGGNIVVDIRNTVPSQYSGWCYFAGFNDPVNEHRCIAWRWAKDEQISGFNPAPSSDQGIYVSGPFCPNTVFTYEAVEGTAIADVNTDKAVAGVSYYNMAGQQSANPFEGVNVKVTRYTDGTTSTAKVVK